jgi:hypothetical protein
MKLFAKNHEIRYVTLFPTATRRIPISTASMSTSKADGLMAEAKKKMESMMSWFSDSPFEEAGELYAQAASQYKAAKACMSLCGFFLCIFPFDHFLRAFDQITRLVRRLSRLPNAPRR